MPSNSFHLLFNQISNEAVGQVHLKVLSRWLAFHVARRKVYIQSRAGHATIVSLRDNYNSTTTWQRNRASVTKQNTKIVWLRCPNGVASHNECRHNNKQLFGLKMHGHVVAAVLSSAQATNTSTSTTSIQGKPQVLQKYFHKTTAYSHIQYNMYVYWMKKKKKRWNMERNVFLFIEERVKSGNFFLALRQKFVGKEFC